MAKLKATPKNYAEAEQVLAGRDSMRLGNNTYLERIKSDYTRTGKFIDSPVIGVRLHDTYIVRLYQSGEITLHTGGYRTVTTKERINQFIKGWVYQKAHVWYYVWPITPGNDEATTAERTVEFEEGMEVQ